MNEKEMAEPSSLTTLLHHWKAGDQSALDELTPMIYDDLRRIARRHLRSERKGHTLQATALVNEAFVRLLGSDVELQDRAHFFAVAARLMRRILADYGRAHNSQKRGGGVAAVTLHDDRISVDEPMEIAEVDAAIDKLSSFDPRKSDILVLHFFGGMTYDETAEALGISAATVDRDLRLAKAWLAHELAND